MPRVIIAASLNMDLAVYSGSLPRPGETVHGIAVAWSPGGKGLNQAVAAARLGAEVALVGFVGADEIGARVREFLAGEGIDLAGLGALEGHATGLATILVDEASQNAIVVVPGANMAWPADAADRIRPQAGDLVVATCEIPDAQIEAAFAKARAAGATTVLNPAPAREVPPAILALADQLILNEVELPMLMGHAVDASDIGDVMAAARMLVEGRQAVVATLGPAGAVVAAGGETWHAHAVKVTAVDTTAAGDCFIGAWVAALARGEGFEAAAEFANRAAAVSVTRRGTAVSLPRLAEVVGQGGV
jgi:ribokinase